MMRMRAVAVSVGALAACATSVAAADPVAPAATASTAANTSYAGPPEQQLLDLERRLATAAQDHGLGGALGSVIDPTDGFVMRPGVLLHGQQAIESALNDHAGPIFWQPDRVFVSRDGDMGMTSGRYVQVVPGAEAIQGRYIAVWRKDGAGDWRLLSESRAADPVRAATRHR
jgi:hypothetical protein